MSWKKSEAIKPVVKQYRSSHLIDKKWETSLNFTSTDVLILIPVLVLMLVLAISICIGKATNGDTNKYFLWHHLVNWQSKNHIKPWIIWKKSVSNVKSTVECAMSHKVIFIWSHKDLLRPYGKPTSSYSVSSLFWWRGF